MEFRNTFKAALVIASLLSANAALANAESTIVVTEQATISTEAASKDRATKANKTAAEHAVKSVLVDTRLDLDIRLIGPTSVKVASKR